MGDNSWKGQNNFNLFIPHILLISNVFQFLLNKQKYHFFKTRCIIFKHYSGEIDMP